MSWRHCTGCEGIDPGDEAAAQSWPLLPVAVARLLVLWRSERTAETYLADVLDRIVSGRTKVNALRELLPWDWNAARAAPIAAAA